IKARPVIRHGAKADILKMSTFEEITADISGKIASMRLQSFKSMAVICKTMETCKAYHAALSKMLDNVWLLTGKEDVYHKGVTIVPSYLSKGLEFDAVFIPDAEDEVYRQQDLDIKLLYVAMTRPLHNLTLYYRNNPSTLLA
ncbi:MAG: ATP-binding domain-containing protein, partial [Clostridiales bacterium]|nr:ATP-binding domain-containing protein [Clostridiales bacterium]